MFLSIPHIYAGELKRLAGKKRGEMKIAIDPGHGMSKSNWDLLR